MFDTYFCSRGADIHSSDLDGNSPTMVAASYGYVDIVRFLQESGADMNKVNRKELNILHLAAQFDRHDMICHLAENEEVRSLVNNTEMYENTPLHIASKLGFTNTVKELLENNFDIQVDQKNEDEKTAIHLASAGGHEEVLKLLLKKDPNGIRDKDEENNTPLHLAATNKMTRTLNILLDQGYLMHDENKNAWTPLDCAAASGAYKCADLLLKYGSPVDPRDRNSTTPLHLSAKHGHHKIVKLLLDSGADLSIEHDNGMTALELAISNRNRNATKAIIDDENWDIAFKHITQERDSRGEMIPITPLRRLIRVFPDLAEEVLDKCKAWKPLNNEEDDAEENKDKREERNQIEFDFQYLDDTFSIKKEDGKFVYRDRGEDDFTAYHKKKYVAFENHPLMIMVREQRTHLLRHPVCLALMKHKWTKVGMPIFLLNLAIYIFYLSLLTVYTLGTLNYDTYPRDSSLSPGPDISPPPVPDHLLVCRYLVLVTLVLLLGVEVAEWYRVGINS